MDREQAMQIAENAISDLAAELKAGKSETLVRYLELLAQFHHYSFGNCMLIAMQRPQATLVAGFRRWKQLGRYVKEGEKGIAILAPIAYRVAVDTDDPQSNAGPKRKSIRGFKIVHVFDLSQTDGAELPAFSQISGDPGKYVERLQSLVGEHNIALTYEELPGGTSGLSRGGSIVIAPDLAPAEHFSVLVHELAHELLHRGERRAETTKTIRETEAEAVAYVVCKSVGIQSGPHASDYIQLYAGDETVLMQSLHHIQTTATQIITALQRAPVEMADTGSTFSVPVF